MIAETKAVYSCERTPSRSVYYMSGAVLCAQLYHHSLVRIRQYLNHIVFRITCIKISVIGISDNFCILPNGQKLTIVRFLVNNYETVAIGVNVLMVAHISDIKRDSKRDWPESGVCVSCLTRVCRGRRQSSGRSRRSRRRANHRCSSRWLEPQRSAFPTSSRSSKRGGTDFSGRVPSEKWSYEKSIGFQKFRCFELNSNGSKII